MTRQDQWYENEYFTYLRSQGYSEYSLKHYQSVIASIKGMVNEPACTALTCDHIRAYQTYLMSQKLKVNTVAARLANLRKYCAWLLKTGKIFCDPSSAIEFPKQTRVLRRNIPTHAEIERMIARIDTRTPDGIRDRALVELAYSTGLRPKEVLKLTLYDVDLARRELLVRQTKTKRDRKVPLGKTAAAWMSRYLSEVRPKYTVKRNSEALFVLAVPKGKPLGYFTLERIFQQYSNHTITCYDLRHACALGMLRNGAHIRAIGELLGHRCLSSTQVYTQLVGADLKKMHTCYHPREKIRLQKPIARSKVPS